MSGVLYYKSRVVSLRCCILVQFFPVISSDGEAVSMISPCMSVICMVQADFFFCIKLNIQGLVCRIREKLYPRCLCFNNIFNATHYRGLRICLCWCFFSISKAVGSYAVKFINRLVVFIKSCLCLACSKPWRISTIIFRDVYNVFFNAASLVGFAPA